VSKLGSFTESEIRELAKSQYDSPRPAPQLDPAHTAIVVVDMIDEFVKPHWSPYWIPDATRQAPLIRGTVDTCRQEGVMVVFLAYETSLAGANFPRTLQEMPIGQGVEEFEDELFQKVAFSEPLVPTSSDLLVLKHTYSGFQGTPLLAVLRNRDITDVVVTGTMTNYCCGATAREAFWHGFRVTFASDLNSTDDHLLHEAELRTLRRGYANIATAAEIVAALREGAAGRRVQAALPGERV
jgi:nicotinamidase-related amidase